MAAALHLSFPPPQQDKADLRTLLHRTFGHSDFRPHQQPVCEAAAAGRDVLLVMPTGAGKSLCYQLPALARGGTALVISPLIALMDDQAGKLASLHLRVARIHSGLPREDCREAARAYLEGRLDFLFIAPERLRVPGFPEMLARRKPALVAIDEAHCISQWGHDFRPDYRTLGQFLPALRPSPLIALTATATPAVQQDIVRALNLQDPAVFITGFRRTNLHIEVVEVSKPQRLELIRKLLAPAAARPAIIYAQSRKAAEEIAGSLGGQFSASAYHAGLDSTTRERVQRAFLSGELAVVVATVAFGMGIDKANVRTVVHAALPGSVEGYYQEIGRAGRDGQPSRAVLLHNFADRRTQEFLLEKSYPPLPDIEKVLGALSNGLSTLQSVQERLHMEREVVEQSVDKLLVQGAVVADLDGSVRVVGTSNWKARYEQQVQYRRAQIDNIVEYAEASSCRMTALIQHFGDLTDSGKPCGVCDICQPGSTSASDAHQPNTAECAEIRAILKALASGPRSAGKVFTDLGWKDRKYFDSVADALARAGLLTMANDQFRSEDGRDITYRKLALTPEGRCADDQALSTVWLRCPAPTTAPKPSRARGANTPRPETSGRDQPLTGDQAALEVRLKQWRLATAKANGLPPFTVFHDSVLRILAQTQPGSVRALEAVRGIGPEKVARYGEAVLALCAGREVASPEPARAKETEPARAKQTLTSAARPSFVTEREQSALLRRKYAVPGDHASKDSRDEELGSTLTDRQQVLEASLRRWRGEEATSSGLPSFFVLSDTALKRVVLHQPQTVAELGSISGLGADKLERYGAALVGICHS